MENKRKAVYNPEADARWNEENKAHRRYLTYRNTTRGFIRNHATIEDINELEQLLKIRKEEIKMKERVIKQLEELRASDPELITDTTLLDWFYEPEADTLYFVDSGMAYDGDDKNAVELYQTEGIEIINER